VDPSALEAFFFFFLEHDAQVQPMRFKEEKQIGDSSYRNNWIK
jgi:hypothetical protein